MDGCASSLIHSSPLTLVKILLSVTWSRISDEATRRADASRMLEMNTRDAPERAAEDLVGILILMLFGDPSDPIKDEKIERYHDVNGDK